METDATLTTSTAKNGTVIYCKTNPEWGQWWMRLEPNGFWTITARNGQGSRVLNTGEFHFWAIVND